MMRKLFIVLAVFLIGFSVAALDCRCCEKELKASSVVVDDEGNAYCSQACMDTMMPKCVICGKPCRSGKWCYPQAPFCSEECQKKNPLPKCSVCDEYTKNFARFKTRSGDLYFCPYCLKLPRCFVCQLPCDGTLTGNALVYCERCKETDEVKEVIKKYGKYENTQEQIKECERCGTKCTMLEVLVDEHIFCSYECARDAAPRCPYCKNPCIEMIGRAGFSKFNGYCSLGCMQLAERPKCSQCGQPYDADSIFGGGLCSWCARMENRSGSTSRGRYYHRSRSNKSDYNSLLDLIGDLYGGF